MTATSSGASELPGSPLILRAELFYKGRSIVGHTMELTSLSALVRTDEPLDLGDRLVVRLSFPGLLEPFDIEAQVVAKQVAAGPGQPAAVKVVFVFAEESEAARFRSAAVEGGAATSPPVGEEHRERVIYRVLLVDDSALIRDTLLVEASKWLSGTWRAQLDMAEGSEQAWRKLTEADYNLAIVDHYLPGDQGADLIKRIRSEPALAGLPVIAISIGGAAAREELIDAGADVFLDKPLEVRDLFATLDHLLSKLNRVPSRRILLVDDSPLFLELAGAALEEAGYTVLRAASLDEVERQSSAHPDLVLMDVRMPEAFGDDVAMVMRHVRGVSVPIYLLSELDHEELQQRAVEADIDGFISKADSMEQLVQRVRSILARRPGGAPLQPEGPAGDGPVDREPGEK
jgi:DNA-binding response OmpR family regulator